MFSIQVLRAFKRKLRQQLLPSDRAEVMEQYLRHLMLQWQDREADLRWATLSVQMTANLRAFFEFSMYKMPAGQFAGIVQGQSLTAGLIPRKFWIKDPV
jgi:hypothetical protein